MGSEYQKPANELRLMKICFDHQLRYGKYDCLREPIHDASPVQSTIGLNGIEEEFESYAILDDFLADIKQLKRSYLAKFPENKKVKRVVNDLDEKFRLDAKGIEACAECVENWHIDRNNYFTKACSMPHLLVFAKLGIYPYWPAKVMSLSMGGDAVYVEFFGDHSQADVPVSDCYLYSNQQESRNEQLNFALNDLKEHIKNVEQRFGRINQSAGFRVRLDPDNMKQQLMNMIPGAFQSSDLVTIDCEWHVSPEHSMKIEDVDDTDESTEENHGMAMDMPSLDSSTESNEIETGKERRTIDYDAINNREEEPEKRLRTDDVMIASETVGADEENSCLELSMLGAARMNQKIDELQREQIQWEEDKRRMQKEIEQLKQQLASAIDQNKKSTNAILGLKEHIVNMTSANECTT